MMMSVFSCDIKEALGFPQNLNVEMKVMIPAKELRDCGVFTYIDYTITTLHGGDRTRSISDTVTVADDDFDAALDEMFEICELARSHYKDVVGFYVEKHSPLHYVIYFNVLG